MSHNAQYDRNVVMETFDLHELILCGSEGFLYELLCIHIGGMETVDLYAMI